MDQNSKVREETGITAEHGWRISNRKREIVLQKNGL